MNRPKPKVAKTEAPKEEAPPKKEDVDMEEGKEVEEDMDVD